MAEEVVAMPVEREPLEAPAHVEASIAAPREHLHAVVKARDNAAGLPAPEGVRDLLQPPIERPQSALELDQSPLAHPLTPRPDRACGPRLRVVPGEQVCQVFPQVIGRAHPAAPRRSRRRRARPRGRGCRRGVPPRAPACGRRP
jgi:hypothetical protein